MLLVLPIFLAGVQGQQAFLTGTGGVPQLNFPLPEKEGEQGDGWMSNIGILRTKMYVLSLR